MFGDKARFIVLVLAIAATEGTVKPNIIPADSDTLESPLPHRTIHLASTNRRRKQKESFHHIARRRILYKKDPPPRADAYDCGSIQNLYNEIYVQNTTDVGALPALPCLHKNPWDLPPPGDFPTFFPVLPPATPPAFSPTVIDLTPTSASAMPVQAVPKAQPGPPEPTSPPVLSLDTTAPAPRPPVLMMRNPARPMGGGKGGGTAETMRPVPPPAPAIVTNSPTHAILVGQPGDTAVPTSLIPPPIAFPTYTPSLLYSSSDVPTVTGSPWSSNPPSLARDSSETATPTVTELVTAIFGFETTFFLALHPTRPAQALLVGTVLTDFLNETIPESWRVLLPKSKASRTRHARQTAADAETEVPLDLVLHSARSTIVQRYSSEWWWSYDIFYECFYRTSGQSVMDFDALQRIKHQVNEAVNSTNFFDSLTQSPLQQDLVAFAYGEVPSSLESEVGAPSATDGNTIGDNVLLPIDPRHWDTRRWFGLGSFSFIIVGFALLSKLASTRKKKRKKKETWTQLGTIEGVDELLRTGWKVRDNQVELYDRTGIGYRDDDSLFLGGCEQKDAIIGTTVSLAKPETVTSRTPDSENQP
jgi:hypothetical protein